MPFPVDEKYIIETETQLGVKFPAEFKSRMLQSNGGELVTKSFEFELYPFFDKSDRKRISRTANHIDLETKNARKWTGFPDKAIAIGRDAYGNKLILIHNEAGYLSDEVYFWNHETGQCEKIFDSVNKLYIEGPNEKSDISWWQKVKAKFSV